MEARGVADGEQLLGVGAGPAAAHLLRNGEIQIQLAVRGAAVTVAAFAGGQRFGGVEGLHADSFRSDALSASVRRRTASRRSAASCSAIPVERNSCSGMHWAWRSRRRPAGVS